MCFEMARGKSAADPVPSRAVSRTLLLLYAATIAGTLLLQLGFTGGLAGLWSPGSVASSQPGATEIDILVGLAVGLAAVLLSRIILVFGWARRMDRIFRRMLASIRPSDAFGLAVMSAVAEELLFRGFLQPKLGLAVTAVIFGLVHIPQTRSQLPWTLMAVGMGFVLGALAEWRGCLLAPVIAHFTVNYFNLHHLVGSPVPPARS